MKLKKHRAGLDEAAKKWISGPVDIEGHKGQDGRYYVLDYVRYFDASDTLSPYPNKHPLNAKWF